MDKDEALKMAIDYLDGSYEAHKVRKACKEALEQPAQEPVAKQYLVVDENDCHGDGSVYRGLRGKDSSIPTYRIETHPAPSWQGLSDDEIWEFIDKADIPVDYDREVIKIARAIEQALRIKNAL